MSKYLVVMAAVVWAESLGTLCGDTGTDDVAQESSHEPCIDLGSKKPDITFTGVTKFDFGTYYALVVGVKNSGQAYSLPFHVRIHRLYGDYSDYRISSMYTGKIETFYVLVWKRGWFANHVTSLTADVFDTVDEANECNNRLYMF